MTREADERDVRNPSSLWVCVGVIADQARNVVHSLFVLSEYVQNEV